MRVVDADKLVDMLYDNEFAVLCPLDEVSGVVDACPTVDAVPVVHGRWVTHYRSGTTVAEGYVSTCCDMWNNRKSDYCPNCGAKMDGGAGHEAG
jgi:hypothetical protein